MDNLSYVESKFKNLDETEKKLHLGKLKQLETIVDLLNCMRESLTRELYVSGVETEKDILKPAQSDSDVSESESL